MILHAYSTVISTAIVLICVIILLWLSLIFGGVFKNPLTVTHKLINKSILELESIKDNLKNSSYNKMIDDKLKKARKDLDKASRFSQQFVYENDGDERMKNVISSIKTLDVSLSLVKKMSFNKATTAVDEILDSAIKELKTKEEVVEFIIDEQKDYYKKN